LRQVAAFGTMSAAFSPIMIEKNSGSIALYEILA
jgi:hypothetical protein